MTDPQGPDSPQYPHPLQQQQAVGAFWQWWREKGAESLASMFRGQQRDEQTLHELNALTSQIAPHLVFEFASGDSAGLDSEFLFILTAEGVAQFRGPARRWLLEAPDADATWAYSDVRLPQRDFGVLMGDEDVQSSDLRFSVDTGQSAIDLSVYHPAFEHLQFSHELTSAPAPQDAQPTIEQLGFVLLDNAFGERAVELWLGQIRFLREEGRAFSATIDDVTGELEQFDAQFPTEGDGRWVVFENEIEGHVYVGRSRPPLRALSAPLLDLHLRIDVPFEATDNGMPTPEAQTKLYELEDALTERIESYAQHIGPVEQVAKLVAVETMNGVRAFHFYAGGTSGVVEELHKVCEGFDGVPAELKISGEAIVDPGWMRVEHLHF